MKASDKELLCKSWNRDLWHDWRSGALTEDEAVFLARRVEFGAAIRPWVPAVIMSVLFWIYDMLFEPVSVTTVSADG